MSSSTEATLAPWATDGAPGATQPSVLRGADAAAVAAADFGTDLREAVPAPSHLVAHQQDAARTAGYADGWAQGQRAARIAAAAAAERLAAATAAADAARDAALHRAMAAVAGAVRGIEQRETAAMGDLTATILASATALAEAIIGYEIDKNPDSALHAVRRALAMAPTTEDVTVRLHPADHRALTGSATAATQSIDGRTVTVHPDPDLQPGDATATYGVTRIDATVANALARAREVLAS
ncbi:hypothetical protein GCM10010123_10220 [Pilimelia anulata]|uniref:Flagellar assembly protein FliH/Type III secretion system HrpE domain-containing protein n=1 Tax=Pilimelia anulata TaxID=53371 RepID=A0A8J3F826_9ACTN|nr:FliH/SctL family protein [Pilimelia anulata]GGJ82520.1 hypothetical protein GCM10010123_10220 [Pilimelia anulata]